MSEAPASGYQIIAAAENFGVRHLFTLSGAHIFPLYDACQKRPDAPKLIDTRHEQTAGFAAEGTARLTRTPGFVAATAGPGVTNLITPLTSAMFNGAPVVAIGGRAPEYRWGSGALQELDHIPIVESVTKSAQTARTVESVGPLSQAAFAVADTPHRGPTFLDIPMDILFSPTAIIAMEQPTESTSTAPPFEIGVGFGHVDEVIAILQSSERPLILAGTDVWQTKAEKHLTDLLGKCRIPLVTNGLARGIVPPSDSLLVTVARSFALSQADTVVVIGTPLDFRVNYGDFGGARVVHITDNPPHSIPKGVVSIHGDLPAAIATLTNGLRENLGSLEWRDSLVKETTRARMTNAEMMNAGGSMINPAGIYRELIPRLTDSTVTIGDGGDFVSYAGKFIEPQRPGRWLDPGPFGALGTAMGYTLAAGLAFPDDPLIVLLGDGAAGFSLMDVDSLVRHHVPATIIVGNNAGWGLERHPMRFLYGYDVLADLNSSRYDLVVEALGGAGETITHQSDIGLALDRALESGVPYLVNIVTDPEIAYPRSTTGV